MCEKCKKDTLVMGPSIGERGRVYLRKDLSGNLSGGVIKPAANGEPINGDAMILKHETGDTYEVVEVIEPKIASKYKPGPSMANNASFRTGWDRIFGNTVIGEA